MLPQGITVACQVDTLGGRLRPDIDFLVVGKINGRSEDHLVAILDPRIHLNGRTKVTDHIDVVQSGDSILYDCDAEAFGVAAPTSNMFYASMCCCLCERESVSCSDWTMVDQLLQSRG